MGLDYSKLLVGSKADAAPKTVLVPPLFERDLKARSRMVKSAYEYQFAKPALRWLFKDYFGQVRVCACVLRVCCVRACCVYACVWARLAAERTRPLALTRYTHTHNTHPTTTKPKSTNNQIKT
jgi:hypothetical protein